MNNRFTFSDYQRIAKRLKEYYKIDYLHIFERCGKYKIYINKEGKEVWVNFETEEIFMKKYKKSDPFNSRGK